LRQLFQPLLAMSVAQVEAFLSKAEADPVLKAQLQAVQTHAEVVPIAEAAGFAITVDDMIRYQASQSELLHWSAWEQLGVID
jgi:predicted ribosomally synthesized peptide with nif11-like leader